jgi:hypothetical protein
LRTVPENPPGDSFSLIEPVGVNSEKANPPGTVKVLLVTWPYPLRTVPELVPAPGFA